MQTGTAPSFKIVGLGGSLGADSTSVAALKTVLAHAESKGVATELFDLRLMGLPMYDPDAAHAPPWAERLADALYQADAIVWSSPLYHGTLSGAFKNALDWLELLGERKPSYLTNKPVGLISTAGGSHGLQAINTMEFAVRALRGWALPLVVPIPRSPQVFDATGTVTDPGVAKQLHALADELVAAARRFSSPKGQASPAQRGATAKPAPIEVAAN